MILSRALYIASLLSWVSSGFEISFVFQANSNGIIEPMWRSVKEDLLPDAFYENDVSMSVTLSANVNRTECVLHIVPMLPLHEALRQMDDFRSLSLYLHDDEIIVQNISSSSPTLSERPRYADWESVYESALRPLTPGVKRVIVLITDHFTELPAAAGGRTRSNLWVAPWRRAAQQECMVAAPSERQLRESISEPDVFMIVASAQSRADSLYSQALEGVTDTFEIFQVDRSNPHSAAKGLVDLLRTLYDGTTPAKVKSHPAVMVPWIAREEFEYRARNECTNKRDQVTTHDENTDEDLNWRRCLPALEIILVLDNLADRWYMVSAVNQRFAQEKIDFGVLECDIYVAAFAANLWTDKKCWYEHTPLGPWETRQSLVAEWFPMGTSRGEKSALLAVVSEGLKSFFHLRARRIVAMWSTHHAILPTDAEEVDESCPPFPPSHFMLARLFRNAKAGFLIYVTPPSLGEWYRDYLAANCIQDSMVISSASNDLGVLRAVDSLMEALEIMIGWPWLATTHLPCTPVDED